MSSKKQEERHSRIIRDLLRQPENKKCFDCPAKGPTYVNLFNNTFICARCSGLHREFNHRVKSITASIFTPPEVELLKSGGNSKAAQIWLAKYKRMDFPEPDTDDTDSIRNFMRAKYVLKRWLDTSLLPSQSWKAPNNENTANKGTFVINPPALSHKSNNFSDNSSNSSLSRHSSLADVRSISPSERRKSSVSDISSDHSFYMNNFGSLKSAPEHNLNGSSNDHVPVNIPTLPKPNSDPLNTNPLNQISGNLGRTNAGSDQNPRKNDDLDDFFSSLSISSTQTTQTAQPPVPLNNTYSQFSELNSTLVSMVQPTQPLPHNGITQVPPQFNPLTSQPLQYQRPIQNQQFSATNLEHSGSFNFPSQTVQQKINNERRTTNPAQFDHFSTLNASNLYNSSLLNFTSTPTNFDKTSNAQQTTAAPKILNPFGQSSLNSISNSGVLKPTNASTSTIASQQTRSVSSPDPYQAFRNLDLNNSNASLTSSTGSPAYSLSPSFHSSPMSQAKNSTSNISDIFGDFVTSPTSTSTESFSSFSPPMSDNDLFSDFQTASSVNSSIFNSPSSTQQRNSSNQSSFFDTPQSHFGTDFSKQLSQRPRSETHNSSNSFSSDLFSATLSSPNLPLARTDSSSAFNSVSNISNAQQRFGSINGSVSGLYESNNSSPSNTNGNKKPLMDPFNLNPNNPFPLVSPTSSTASISNPQPAKEMGHAKKISFDTAFNDLDPLRSRGNVWG